MEYFWMIIEVLATVIENFIVLECYSKLFNCKYVGLKKNAYFLLFLIFTTSYVTLLNQIVIFDGWLSLITIFLFITYGLLCLKGSLFKKIIIPIGLFAIILCINLSVTFTFSFFLDISSEALMSVNNAIRLLTLFITKFLFLIITRVLLHVAKKDNFELKKSELLINIILIMLTYSIGIAIVEIQMKDQNQDFLCFISAFCIIAINVFCFYMFRKFSNENKKEMQISLLKLQLSEQKAMIEDAANIGKEIKKTEHDLKHHFLSILGLLEDQHFDKARQYIEKLLGQYETSIFKYISIDNSVINGILNFKISRCRANQIDIKLAIETDFSAFDELDICILLSNLLDNAIEASISINSPKIEFSIKNNGNYLCILVRNKIEKSVLDENNELRTTKKDSSMHGFGLYSVEKIVEKYDGIKSIYERNGYFTVDVWLKRNIITLEERIKEEMTYQTRQK